MPDEKVDAVKGLTLTADGNGSVFDVPAEDVDTYLTGKIQVNFRIWILNIEGKITQSNYHHLIQSDVYVTITCSVVSLYHYP